MLLLAAMLLAQTVTPRESIDVVYYGGKRVVYNADESRVYLMDSAWVRYKDLQLHSDSIIYEIKSHLLSSYRRSYFRSASDSVVGTELHYNVDTRKGYMTLAATELNDAFFSGQDLWLVKENTIDVNDGAYTTCDRPRPHYRFVGNRVRVFMDDMVIAEPLVLKLGSVPVLAAPFWFFPISRHRKSGFIPFKVGQSSTEGFYAKNLAWYWAINEYSDATFAVDVMSRKGFKPSVEGIYAIGPFASGHVTGSYLTEADTKNRRYTLNAQHASMFLFGTKLEASADFQSDTTFIADYSENQLQWLKKELDSYVSLSRVFKRIGNINLNARRHDDFQNHRSDRDFPSISASFVSLPVFRDWNFNSGFGAANHTTTQDSAFQDTLGQTRYDAGVSKTTLSRSFAPTFSLSLPRSFLGGLTLPLSGGYSESRLVHHDSTGDSVLSSNRQANAGTGLSLSHVLFGFLNLSEGLNFSENVQFAESTYARAGYGAHAATSLSLNRIYELEALGVHGVLHKATPTLNYSYTPNTRSRALIGTPRFDTLPVASRLGFSLLNDFEVKVGEQRTKRGLGNLNFSSDYDFRTDSFSPVTASSDLNIIDLPQAQFAITGNAALDLYNRAPFSYSLDSRLSYKFTIKDTVRKLEQDFSIGLSHYLSKQQNMLAAELRLEPRGWKLGITGGWNIKDKRVTDYTIDVVKDLHCWELVGNLSRLGSRWTYDFKIRIKAIPDVQIGKGLFGSFLP